MVKRLSGASWKGLRRGGACEGARSPVWPGFRRGGRCGFHKVVACKAGITRWMASQWQGRKHPLGLCVVATKRTTPMHRLSILK